MMKMTAKDFQLGVKFVQTMARDVDKALFAYYFEKGTATAVLDCLVAYQNEDGGFGHGIESDFRLPASSPMATSVGLQYCTAVGATSEHPIVQRAIRYLCDTYEPGDFWYATDMQVNTAPHAFWWHVDQLVPPDDVRWPNPSAELVGYLHHYAELVPADLLARATARAQANLESSAIISGNEMQKYNILCWQRALPFLPQELQTAVSAKIRHTYQQAHPINPETLGELSIIAFAPTPQAIIAQQFPTLVDQLLDQEINGQGKDGGWWPTWHWGQFDEVWPTAKQEWAGKITVETLHVLQAFNKVSAPQETVKSFTN